MLEILFPKLVGSEHTFHVIAYKGVGRIPRDFKGTTDANKRILLDRLPRLLRGYGNIFASYPSDYPACLIVVCDLDDRCLKSLRRELDSVLDACQTEPETRFCIAVEEGEAWLLGDISAVKRAYPGAKDQVLRNYINDSICGTWEYLADVVYPGGRTALLKEGMAVCGSGKVKMGGKDFPLHGDRREPFSQFSVFL